MSEFSALAHGFPENPKVMKLHDRAFRLYIIAIDYCSRNLTDGHVSSRAVKVCSAILDSGSARWWNDLVKAGLLKHDAAGDGFWIHDYTKHQVKAEAVKSLRDKRREAGVRGAEKRWAKKRAADAAADEDGKHGKSDGKSDGKSHMPAEQKQEVELDQDPGRQFGSAPAGGALSGELAAAMERARAAATVDERPADERELLCRRLLHRIGDDADGGTPNVVRKYARKLAPASIAKVIESLEMNTPDDRAAYAVGALRDELRAKEVA